MKRLTAIAIPLILAATACDSDKPTPPKTDDRTETVATEEEPKPEPDCELSQFEDDGFMDCIAYPEEHSIGTRLMGEDDEPLRSLTALALERDAGDISFAMNGGMFDKDGMPIGYYVEDGKKLHEINDNEGPGNFHMLPNGIFFGTDGKWQVLSSDQFRRKIGTRPQFATQSGPMLVIDGKLHPKIAKDGESKYVRNAVGVDEEGRAHFVISDEPVSFGKLARFMRDKLGTPNALYLDGKVSALWDPGADRLDTTTNLGPLIIVRHKPAAEVADKP